ncbi:hypothetical protein PFTANZ_05990, partial [Plasmodium falciparum Tanzania (2000708)]
MRLHALHTKLMPSLKKEENKETRIDYIRKELEKLKSEKSYEELLFISMNECNKKIYNEINKIPELFFDISEISEYSSNDIIISSDINNYSSYPLFNKMDNNLLKDNKEMNTQLGIYDKLKHKLSSFTSSTLGKKKNSIGNTSNNIFVFKRNSTEDEYKKEEENETVSFNNETNDLLKQNMDNTHIGNDQHDDVIFVANNNIPSNHNKNKKKESIKDFVLNLFKQRNVKNDEYTPEDINNMNNDMYNDLQKDIHNDNNYPLNENQKNLHESDEQNIDILTDEPILLNLNNEGSTNKNNSFVHDNNKINE